MHYDDKQLLGDIYQLLEKVFEADGAFLPTTDYPVLS